MNPGHALAPVLVAVDRGGSPSAVRFGAAEAVRTARPVRLLHVAPAHDGWLGSVGRDSLRMALRRADAALAARVDVPVAVVPSSRVGGDGCDLVVEGDAPCSTTPSARCC